MVQEALADAGLTLADVDGVCHPHVVDAASPSTSASTPASPTRTMTGGSSFEVHVEHAAAAIAAGLCDVVVDVYAATPRSDRKRDSPAAPATRCTGPNPTLEWEMPYGLRLPMGPYALAASRHMADVRHHVGAARRRSR